MASNQPASGELAPHRFGLALCAIALVSIGRRPSHCSCSGRPETRDSGPHQTPSGMAYVSGGRTHIGA